MAAPWCFPKPMARFCKELLPLPALVEAICSVWLIPLGIHELLTLLLFLCFTVGHLLVLRRVSTAPHNDASAGREQDAGDKVVRPPEGQPAAPPARKIVLAVSCGVLLLAMLAIWGLTRQERCLLPFLTYSTAGLMITVFLLDSAKRRFNLGVLLLMLSSSGLVHVFVPGNWITAELGPAGCELPLLSLLLLGLMGTLMLVSFANPGKTFSFDLPGRCTTTTSTRPALTLVALSCSGLVHLLVPTTAGTHVSLSGEPEPPVLILFLALMVSLVVVLLNMSP